MSSDWCLKLCGHVAMIKVKYNTHTQAYRYSRSAHKQVSWHWIFGAKQMIILSRKHKNSFLLRTISSLFRFFLFFCRLIQVRTQIKKCQDDEVGGLRQSRGSPLKIYAQAWLCPSIWTVISAHTHAHYRLYQRVDILPSERFSQPNSRIWKQTHVRD